MIRLLIALTLAVALSFFDIRWQVKLPPLPNISPQLHAASDAELTCGQPVDAGAWTLTRCEDSWGNVCFQSSSGMVACLYE